MAYETRYRDVEVTKELGYDRIRIHRPKFIYFEFTGLRPSAPHWIWFGKKEVTKFCNTSYSKSDWTGAGRNSVLKEPGEKFTNATEFPSGSGLPYGGATAAGGKNNPLFSTANGILKGMFYLQSNSSFSWRMIKGYGGNELLAIDIYGLKKSNAYSYASAIFRGAGQYENYWKGTEKESYQVWVEPPRQENDNSHDNIIDTGSGNDNNFSTIETSIRPKIRPDRNDNSSPHVRLPQLPSNKPTNSYGGTKNTYTYNTSTSTVEKTGTTFDWSNKYDDDGWGE